MENKRLDSNSLEIELSNSGTDESETVIFFSHKRSKYFRPGSAELTLLCKVVAAEKAGNLEIASQLREELEQLKETWK